MTGGWPNPRECVQNRITVDAKYRTLAIIMALTPTLAEAGMALNLKLYKLDVVLGRPSCAVVLLSNARLGCETSHS